MVHTFATVLMDRLDRRKLLQILGFSLMSGLVVAGCTSPSGENAGQSAGQAAQAMSYEQRLAAHLTAQGATMYGAFWCPHCADQKNLFGDAVDDILYVECDPEGENAQPQLCKDKDIQGYPTWEINGEFYPGTQSLEELARLSGFQE